MYAGLAAEKELFLDVAVFRKIHGSGVVRIAVRRIAQRDVSAMGPVTVTVGNGKVWSAEGLAASGCESIVARQAAAMAEKAARIKRIPLRHAFLPYSGEFASPMSLRPLSGWAREMSSVRVPISPAARGRLLISGIGEVRCGRRVRARALRTFS